MSATVGDLVRVYDYFEEKCCVAAVVAIEDDENSPFMALYEIETGCGGSGKVESHSFVNRGVTCHQCKRSHLQWDRIEEKIDKYFAST